MSVSQQLLSQRSKYSKHLFFLLLFVLNKNNYFLFGLIFIKKNNQTGFFKKKQFQPTDFSSVRLFWEKTGSNRFGSVFSGFGSVFRFGSIFLVSDL
jgi:hypothetical protein